VWVISARDGGRGYPGGAPGADWRMLLRRGFRRTRLCIHECDNGTNDIQMSMGVQLAAVGASRPGCTKAMLYLMRGAEKVGQQGGGERDMGFDGAHRRQKNGREDTMPDGTIFHLFRDGLLLEGVVMNKQFSRSMLFLERKVFAHTIYNDQNPVHPLAATRQPSLMFRGVKITHSAPPPPTPPPSSPPRQTHQTHPTPTHSAQ